MYSNTTRFDCSSILQVVQDQMEQTVVMPNSVSLSLLPEDELQELMKKKVDSRPEPSPMILPKGVLSVQLIEAKNLCCSQTYECKPFDFLTTWVFFKTFLGLFQIRSFKSYAFQKRHPK